VYARVGPAPRSHVYFDRDALASRPVRSKKRLGVAASASDRVLREEHRAEMNDLLNCMSSEMFPSFSGCPLYAVTHQWVFPFEASIRPFRRTAPRPE